MKYYIDTHNDEFIVYMHGDMGEVPILRTKRQSEADLMLNYLTII